MCWDQLSRRRRTEEGARALPPAYPNPSIPDWLYRGLFEGVEKRMCFGRVLFRIGQIVFLDPVLRFFERHFENLLLGGVSRVGDGTIAQRRTGVHFLGREARTVRPDEAIDRVMEMGL